MLQVRRRPQVRRPAIRAGLAGLAGQIALLAALQIFLGVGVTAWVAGLGYGAAGCLLLVRGLAVSRPPVLGAADRVTLVRAVLTGGVAALVADSAHLTTTVALASVALALDVVDGYVARRTGSASEFGARFDMEVDAFLILALSVAAARDFGLWVLAIGLARYLFGAAALAIVWLRAPVPPSRWRKVVAAVQGVTLTVAISGLVLDAICALALVIALGLLGQSFGSQVQWQWQHRPGRRVRPRTPPSPARRIGGVVATVAALSLVWFALLLPDRLDQVSVAAFARIPVEALVVVAVALVLPAQARQWVASIAGLLLGALLIFKLLDMGFYNVLDRPFNPITDQATFGPALGVLSDSIGHRWAVALLVAAVTLAVAVLVLMPLCVLRLTRLAARNRPNAARAVGVLALAWVLSVSLGLHIVPGEPLASGGAADLAFDHVRAAGLAIEDDRDFAAALHGGADPYAKIPAGDLLTGLRGKDVLVVFVESYGKVAVHGSAFSPQVDTLLQAGNRELVAAGYGSRSAFLTSPTFGGISWLAHSTLQSGLWIDNQNRYDRLVSSRRYTLSDAFKKGGWRTVSDVPSDGGYWPQGKSFYHYDKLYNRVTTGYAGPRFGYAKIPDQYTLAKFQSLELAGPHRPLFGEIDLDSSHEPWNPLPSMVPWNQLGDGSIYDNQSVGQPTTTQLWQHTDKVRANYGKSVRYTMTSLISFLKTFHDPNLVLVVLGDHQPNTTVSGNHASHDVPISVIADDPAVLHRIDSWHWEAGLLPSPTAPVWKMDAFRNRFLDAYDTRHSSSVRASGRH